MDETMTIIVAGATGSIGRAAAQGLARRGHRVVLLGRRLARLQEEVAGLKAELERAAFEPSEDNLRTLVIDFTDLDSVRRAGERALELYSRIDGLILSVGAFLQDGPRVLPNGHEAMFTANVVGPFLLTELLLPRLVESGAVVAHVIAPFEEELDFSDLESLKHHRAMVAFNRTKVCNRMMAGELARRYGDKLTSVAFDPSFVIDKKDPDLRKRWPKGAWGVGWRIAAMLAAKPPATAGEPLAELVALRRGRRPINGALFKLYHQVAKPDAAMKDVDGGRRLWEELARMTGAISPHYPPSPLT